MQRTVNYKHLHYFWAVARAGGLAAAAARLHLTPQTLSGQIKQLEHAMGTALFAGVLRLQVVVAVEGRGGGQGRHGHGVVSGYGAKTRNYSSGGGPAGLKAK